MDKKVQKVIQDVYEKDPEKWDAYRAKLEKALADGEAKIQGAEKAIVEHADKCKAKNPEVFANIEKAMTVCRDKLNAAIKAFTSATSMLKEQGKSMSAAVVAKVASAYGECVHLLKDGKKAFDDAAKQTKASFPEMFPSDESKAPMESSSGNALTDSSSSLEEAQKIIEDAVADKE